MFIYQLTNTTAYQMMGYVIKTGGGETIVIDGGNHGQSDELYRVLCEVGKNVDLWILTHEHSDHYGSIIDLFDLHDDINVKKFMYNDCAPRIKELLDDEDAAEVTEWNEFIGKSGFNLGSFYVGQVLDIGGVKIECLGRDNPEIHENIMNNQSLVLRISDGAFSIIFLADLGIEGGDKLVSFTGDELKSTAVQMAHHGQNGVSKAVYEKIGAKYAFWPTPKWLWENTPYLGGEPGEGHFQTPEVIGWMKELGCINITSFDKTIVFDTDSERLIDK